MSTNSSLKTIQDGLVFYYDTNNPKSYKGKPTTNLLSNPTNEVIGTTSEFVQYADLAPIFDTYGTSVAYSLSLDLKAKIAGSVLAYMQNGSWSKYNFVYQSVNVDTVYNRFYFNNITPSIQTPSETQAILAFYSGYGSGIIPSIKNVQVEIAPYATPFVVGTRSVTQGLVDLTKRTAIDLTYAAYDSNTGLSFNGSNAYFTTPTINLGNKFTISAWVYNTNVSADTVVVGTDANGCDNWFGAYNGYLFALVTEIADVNNISIGGTIALSNNRWTHIAMTVNTTVVNLYVNGVFDRSYTTAFNIGNWDGTFSFGRRCPSVPQRYFNGNIDSVGMYTRALSSDEILQNYNRTKSRYRL